MRQALLALALAMSLGLAAPARAETVVETGAGAPTATPQNLVAPGVGTPAAATQPASQGTSAGLEMPDMKAPDAKPQDAATQSALMPAGIAPIVVPLPEPVVIPRSIVAQINLSRQRMEVTVDGVPRYSWPISTARRGYRTPVGSYRPQRMYRRYFSRKYDNAPMPYSIFFNGGYAIHGTTDLKRLGRPASHGCVRLHPSNAATLFALVKEYGAGNTRIIVTR
ncbi:ErfK/YbiS/YcfS/YnhG family protein [Ancylobacter novellus DSM 506]|uniref:ErfK/YbiS/YcfS/YnhG family protein n=2 Tax=Ancylobacter novellus TaxID=921 RepID=D7A712_ANCN5|nr:ErfK/YbiS/YcfS/YnhG family protein [Ancylobacter novellus DSM 506]